MTLQKIFFNTKKGKKGTLSMEFVVKYLIAFVAFFVLALFVAKFLGVIGGQGVEQACRTSVIAGSKIQIRDSDISKLEHIIPLNCQAQDVTLPTQSTRNLDSDEIKELVQRDIADLMAQCWWMYGNGQITEVFGGKSEKGGLTNDNNKPCGICYTFYIPTSLGNDKGDPFYKDPILQSEFELYLATHNYKPGILQGGGALPSRTQIYDFTIQKNVPSSFTRSLTRQRLFASRRSLEDNLADLTNIYELDYGKRFDLIESLRKINSEDIQASFVIVPELEGEDFKKFNNIGLELLDEWDLGTPDLFNGMLFLFSLKDGKLIYAAQANADAVISQATIEQIIVESKFYDLMGSEDKEGNPNEAILALAKGLENFVKEMGEDGVSDKISFQQSYLSYITGGLMEPPRSDELKNKNINVQGVIKWSDAEFKDLPDASLLPKEYEDGKETKNPKTFALGAGYRYAILFLSNDVEGRSSNNALPPSLVVALADEITGDNTYCKVQN